jgi:4-amino-4-deoxy-L-arabinose transferase-like glycosyltransferase
MTVLLLLGILAAATLLRVWDINATGLNSDEAVYNGQGASIAGVRDLAPYFPTFRAHPLLFQTLLSLGFHLGHPELFGRLAAAGLGVLTVFVTFLLGQDLYGRRAGLVAALLLALMPYHVIVTRQILLDGPMVLWSTVTLFALGRYALTHRPHWLYAAAGAMGATFLSKESSIVLVGAMYAFLALTPTLRTGWRQLIAAAAVLGVILSAFPLALTIAGATRTGGNFMAWQLFRRPNHEWTFYPATVPVFIGLAVVATAALGLWLLRRRASWRETLLLSWIAVPALFFQLFPVKGFQYLLPLAPAVAVLAARFLVHYDFAARLRGRGGAALRPAAIAIVAVSLAIPSWVRVQPSTSATFLAGSGGVPGGREAGRWIARNVPVGARMMSVGPSMANILQYYGHRKIYGLSVSPNPLHRNPVYEPMHNPDRMIRDNELQYIVWDGFSAARSPFFASKLTRYVERYHGRVAHTETVPVRTAGGRIARKPVITIYEVRP